MINAFAEPLLTVTRRHYLPVFTFCLILFGSCTTVHQSLYFENAGTNDTTIKKYVNKELDFKVRKGDMLLISITTVTPDVGAYNSANNPGYNVDNEGNIYMYNIGKMHVEGLTKKEIKASVEKQLSPYLKDPLVTVRFLNHTVTVMGEVNHSQVFPYQENMNLVELLTMAGEIRTTGRKDNVLLIRDSDSGKQFHRINMLKANVFNSPEYYIRPDDIVYVEPKKVKVVVGQQTTQIVGLALSLISVILILIRGLK